MINSPFATLISQIEREFGVSIPVSPSADVTSVPRPLRPLYLFSDGLTLPFASIHKMGDCDRATFPEWTLFGSDNYFSYFLCHATESPALTTWDHEAGHEPEGVFDSAIDWLTAEYESFIKADTNENTVQITEVPVGVPKTAIIAEIKRISSMPSSQLLGQLRSGRFTAANVVRSEAFAVVRRLHALGIACHVECDA